MLSIGKPIWRTYILNLIVLTLIFLVLYHSFIFGGQMYAYEDIGSDTINQYLPMMVYQMELLEQGQDGIYDLRNGLGQYVTGIPLKYMNPFQLPVMLFGPDYLHVGLLVSTYLKYAALCFFALLYFLRFFKNEKTASICALLWTFSGYAVLWGQHYHFLDGIVFFTVAIYGFQLFLEEDKKQHLVVLAMAVLLSSSYYFLYICCYFCFVYGILYLKFCGKPFSYIIKRVGLFAMVMVLAGCISAVALLPETQVFLSSSRTAEVTASIREEGLFYPVSVILSFAARLLSNNLIGVGNHFRGPKNYYECAILSVSILFVFSFVYLMHRKCWKKVLGITVVSVILLCMPLTSQIINFSTIRQRWTFILCFAQIIAIGYALTDLQNLGEEKAQKYLFPTVVISDVLLAAAAAVFLCQEIRVGDWLDRKACITLVCIVAVYHAAFFVLWKDKKKHWNILLAVVAVELVLANYATVNNRGTISIAQWKEEMYTDGTSEVVQWITSEDDSLYRINKTYLSAYYTDSLIQGYNGMGTYSSTNSAEVLNLVHSFGYDYAENWFGFDGEDLLANTMLGVKYIISENDAIMNPDYYEFVYQTDKFSVYQNRFWLGFGYWYPVENVQTKENCGTTLEKIVRLSQSYYMAQPEESATEETVQGIKTVDLLPLLTKYSECKGTLTDVLQLSGTGADMLLFFDIPDLGGNWLVSGVKVKMTAQAPARMSLYVATDSYAFTTERYDYLFYPSDSGCYYLDNTTLDEITEIRLDISDIAQEICVESVELILVDEKILKEKLETLQENSVTDFYQEGNAFYATVQNTEKSEEMLCIPLVYAEQWQATVDGQSVRIENINGGLVGLRLAPGEHEIRIEYIDRTGRLGLELTIFGVGVYCMILLLSKYAIKKKQST